VHTGFCWGNVREGDHMEDPGMNGRIILKQILGKWLGSGCGQVAGCCECGNESSGSVKCGEFHD
jgi:hypothetical protein